MSELYFPLTWNSEAHGGVVGWLKISRPMKRIPSFYNHSSAERGFWIGKSPHLHNLCDTSNSHLFHFYYTNLNRLFLDFFFFWNRQGSGIAGRTKLLKLKFVLDWQKQLQILIRCIWYISSFFFSFLPESDNSTIPEF